MATFVHTPYRSANAECIEWNDGMKKRKQGWVQAASRIPAADTVRVEIPRTPSPVDGTAAEADSPTTSTGTSPPDTPTSTPPRNRSARKKRLCLDYVKGNCRAHRWQCKYLHPNRDELSWCRQHRVCHVFYFNGACKFGNDCPSQHPATNRNGEPIRPLVLPERERTSSLSSGSTTPPPTPAPVALPSDPQAAAKRVCSVLNRLTDNNVPRMVEQLLAMQSEGLTEASELIDVVCRRAPRDGQAQVQALAKVMYSLGKATSLDVAHSILRWYKEWQADPDQSDAQRVCAVRFMGALVQEKVLQREHVLKMFEAMFRPVTTGAHAEVDVGVGHLCAFFDAGQPALSSVLGPASFRHQLERLEHVATRHSTLSQMRVMNLVESLTGVTQLPRKRSTHSKPNSH